MKRKFVCMFWFVSWTCISFGFHLDFGNCNIEIHLPFGFIKIGFETYSPDSICMNYEDIEWRIKGIEIINEGRGLEIRKAS